MCVSLFCFAFPHPQKINTKEGCVNIIYFIGYLWFCMYFVLLVNVKNELLILIDFILFYKTSSLKSLILKITKIVDFEFHDYETCL